MRNKIFPNSMGFLQKTYSNFNDDAIWNDEFHSKIYYSHGKSNLCDVWLLCTVIKIKYKNNFTGKNDFILTIDTEKDNF